MGINSLKNSLQKRQLSGTLHIIQLISVLFKQHQLTTASDRMNSKQQQKTNHPKPSGFQEFPRSCGLNLTISLMKSYLKFYSKVLALSKSCFWNRHCLVKVSRLSKKIWSFAKNILTSKKVSMFDSWRFWDQICKTKRAEEDHPSIRRIQYLLGCFEQLR